MLSDQSMSLTTLSFKNSALTGMPRILAWNPDQGKQSLTTLVNWHGWQDELAAVQHHACHPTHRVLPAGSRQGHFACPYCRHFCRPPRADVESLVSADHATSSLAHRMGPRQALQ